MNKLDYASLSSAQSIPVEGTMVALGAGFFASKIPTQMFNGYAEQVGSLYSGMDLTRYY